MQVPDVQNDIDALLRRAAECELAAEGTEDPADKALSLWLAGKYREKAERLAKQCRPDSGN